MRFAGGWRWLWIRVLGTGLIQFIFDFNFRFAARFIWEWKTLCRYVIHVHTDTQCGMVFNTRHRAVVVSPPSMICSVYKTQRSARALKRALHLDASIIHTSILTFISPSTHPSTYRILTHTLTHRTLIQTLLHFHNSLRNALCAASRGCRCNMNTRRIPVPRLAGCCLLRAGGNGFLGQHLIKLLQERSGGGGGSGNDEMTTNTTAATSATTVKEIRCVDLVPFEQRLGKSCVCDAQFWLHCTRSECGITGGMAI